MIRRSFVLDLPAHEIEIVKLSMKAAVEGEFFPDWEFPILFGVDRETVRRVLESWPDQTVDDDEFLCATVGSLNNLAGYPHGQDEALEGYVPGGLAAIMDVLHLLRELKAEHSSTAEREEL